MGPPNSTWRHIIDQAARQPEILKDPETIKNVQNILQTNVSVCTSLGHGFLSQMSRIYTDMLNFYRQAHRACKWSIVVPMVECTHSMVQVCRHAE